ncbi:hypothetical protein HGM15179_019628 [Zosterops borbonicus]|uniref:GLTSCR protein conserved domain-containing protein n=1 Tax=Zosterops borbonicus TaxID=364589 RepID=A0A8K1D9B8_9PASS|nr:hypothetical protein HGM15179_019628 [Zosterops borbonicus]
MEAKLALKKPPVLQPSKEACLLEQLHKHQGSVLHPEFRTPFRSVGDALRRLLPYHVYQGVLPGETECRKVDEEFEAVSEQLLRRTRAMLNKYRLLLLEESRVRHAGPPRDPRGITTGSPRDHHGIPWSPMGSPDPPWDPHGIP